MIVRIGVPRTTGSLPRVAHEVVLLVRVFSLWVH